MSQRQSGNVGALEEESLNFSLNVPYTSDPSVGVPFQWVHHASSPIPTAIKTLLTRWAADQKVYVKYLHDGTAGWKGQGVIQNVSMTGGMEAPISFSANFQMDGQPTDV